jgi:hypothetical protein
MLDRREEYHLRVLVLGLIPSRRISVRMESTFCRNSSSPRAADRSPSTLWVVLSTTEALRRRSSNPLSSIRLLKSLRLGCTPSLCISENRR